MGLASGYTHVQRLTSFTQNIEDREKVSNIYGYPVVAYDISLGRAYEGLLDSDTYFGEGEAVNDMLHAPTLQVASSEVAGHSIATPSLAEVTSRERMREPPSHAAEQLVHALQPLTEHSRH
jgi:hypothetical protein